MLQAELVDNEIKATGQVEVDDVYPDIHCEGFGWWVLTVLPDRIAPREITIWGKCQNPDCPDPSCVEHDHWPTADNCEACAWRGVWPIELEELEMKLAGCEA